MELRQLEYFAAVARHRHFGRAADEVHVTQSALSQQISRLENELGLTLLTRTPQGAELTPAGTELNERAQLILAQVAEARIALDGHAGGVRGVARVAAATPDARALPQALVAFHLAHPGIQLALRHGSAAEVVELLGRGAVDVGLVAIHGDNPRVPPGAAVQVVAREPLQIVCAPGDALDTRTDVAIGELRGRPVILPERETALRALITGHCEAAGFSPLPLLETSDPATIRWLAAAGLGLGVVPASWLADDSGPPVRLAAFAAPAPIYEVALLSSMGGRVPARDLLVEHLTLFFASA
jgi:DNA-binding transcriptional LysR family regulator